MTSCSKICQRCQFFIWCQHRQSVHKTVNRNQRTNGPLLGHSRSSKELSVSPLRHWSSFCNSIDKVAHLLQRKTYGSGGRTTDTAHERHVYASFEPNTRSLCALPFPRKHANPTCQEAFSFYQVEAQKKTQNQKAQKECTTLAAQPFGCFEKTYQNRRIAMCLRRVLTMFGLASASNDITTNAGFRKK